MYKENFDKKYESFKIPDRPQDRTEGTNHTQPSSGQPRSDVPPSREDELFYEIEYDAGPFPGVGKYVLKSAKIEPPKRDEVRERFDQMRDIARENRTLYFKSSPFYDAKVRQENSMIFYKQGMFMKDFEDHYEKSVPYTSYFPFYQMMGYEQLRTYFTWRTGVRGGTVAETSLSYAFLYIYELLNNIGVSNPQDGLEKLLFFWKEYRAYDKTIDKYVPRWLKDYHVYYELPQTFQEFVAQNDLGMYYPEMAESEDDFDLLCSISKYDIRKSVFYTEDRVGLIKDCFAFTAEQLRQVFGKNGLDFEESIFQPMKNMSIWTPFKDALFYPWMRQRDRRVVLSEKEIYVCSRNSWKFNKVLTTESGKQFLGYVMKQMEAVLRKLTKYKYSITAGIRGVNPVTLTILREAGLSLEDLITNAVQEFYREATKTVVRVDTESLDRIRREALLTQEKLTVEEEEEWRGVMPSAAESAAVSRESKAAPADSKVMPPETAISPMETVGIRSESAVSLSETASSMPGKFTPSPEPEDSFVDSWQELKSALTDVETKALFLLLRGETDIKKFADEQGIMLEILMDGINEKAMDLVGDNLLDGEFAIYEDYIEQVKEMVEET